MEPLAQFQQAMNDVLADGKGVSQPHEVTAILSRCLAGEPEAFPELAAAAYLMWYRHGWSVGWETRWSVGREAWFIDRTVH